MMVGKYKRVYKRGNVVVTVATVRRGGSGIDWAAVKIVNKKRYQAIKVMNKEDDRGLGSVQNA